MEREPSKRYDSAEALAQELERRLRDECVLARPPGMWDWLRQEWRNKPPPSTYSWQALIWLGIVTLTTHSAIFVVVLLAGAAPWVWAITLARLVGLWEVYRRYSISRIRQLGIRERHLLTIGLGHMAVEVALSIAYGPLTTAAPARQVLNLYPALLAASGMATFIAGSTYWGRLLPLGLGLIALAPLLAWLPEWAPLLFAIVESSALWWWGYCARKYHLLQPANPTPARA